MRDEKGQARFGVFGVRGSFKKVFRGEVYFLARPVPARPGEPLPRQKCQFLQLLAEGHRRVGKFSQNSCFSGRPEKPG